MRSRSKYVVAGFLLCLLAIVLLPFLLLHGPHPLPFDADAFVSSSRIAVLPRRPSFAQRLEHLILITEDHLFDHRPLAFSVSGEPVTKWGVQSLLNRCSGLSNTSYLMSGELAAGTVSFGVPTTSTLHWRENGPQLITAIEDTVCHSNVTWLDSSKGWRTEQLELLRFPEQKTIVVLPKSEVADFLRTNKIEPGRFHDSR